MKKKNFLVTICVALFMCLCFGFATTAYFAYADTEPSNPAATTYSVTFYVKTGTGTSTTYYYFRKYLLNQNQLVTKPNDIALDGN